MPIPTSPPVCTLRQSLTFLRDPAAFTAADGLAMGDVYRVRAPGRRLFVVTDPQIAEALLVSRADSFHKSRIYWSTLRRMMGDSLGALDGEGWAHLHRVESPFFTPRAVEGYLVRIAEQTAEHMRRVEERSSRNATFELLPSLSILNARILLEALFGRVNEPRAPEIARRIVDGHQIIAWTGKYPWRPIQGLLSGSWRRANRHRAYFDEYVAGLGASSGRRPPANLLDALADTAADPNAPVSTRSLVRNEVMFHLGAGIETQAAAESWTLHLLGDRPDALQRVRAEVQAVAEGRTLRPADVEALDWTRCVVQEAIRLYPPVYGLLRDCHRSVDLGGLRAQAGDSFLVSVYAIHRNPRWWGDPAAFRPSRFAAGAPAVARYAYIPFGAGKHACIGQHLALPAMILLVAEFARRFDWTFEDRVRPDTRSSLKPAGPLRMRLRLRSPALPALRPR